MRRDANLLCRLIREQGPMLGVAEAAAGAPSGRAEPAGADASDSRAATEGPCSPPARAPDPPLSPAEAMLAGGGPLPPAALRAQAESWISGRIRRAEPPPAAAPEPVRGPVIAPMTDSELFDA
eukprot:3704837-Alexandrium_andersonii.AAC.1